MKKVKLEPCPFCGGEAILSKESDHHGEYFDLGCKDAKCCGYLVFYTEPIGNLNIAIKAWNGRKG